jgi:hypothetical protein
MTINKISKIINLEKDSCLVCDENKSKFRLKKLCKSCKYKYCKICCQKMLNKCPICCRNNSYDNFSNYENININNNDNLYSINDLPCYSFYYTRLLFVLFNLTGIFVFISFIIHLYLFKQ